MNRLHPSPAPEGQELFSASAARLAGVSALVLGWRPAEFWSATPVELAAILDAMGGAQGGVSGDELERLKRMFPDG